MKVKALGYIVKTIKTNPDNALAVPPPAPNTQLNKETTVPSGSLESIFVLLTYPPIQQQEEESQ